MILISTMKSQKNLIKIFLNRPDTTCTNQFWIREHHRKICRTQTTVVVLTIIKMKMMIIFSQVMWSLNRQTTNQQLTMEVVFKWGINPQESLCKKSLILLMMILKIKMNKLNWTLRGTKNHFKIHIHIITVSFKV
jgi:hypothetical protein